MRGAGRFRGGGPKRTPRLAARYGNEYNLGFSSVPDTEAAFGRARQACEAADRGPDSLICSAAVGLCCGADEAEVARRAAAIGMDPDQLRANAAAGTPSEVLDTLGRYAGIGATRAYLQVLDLTDLDHLRLVASEVLHHIR